MPVSYEYQPINPETADRRDAENIASFFIPYGVTIFFYMMIVTSSTMMLQAITKEKENRVMEVLLSSTSPADIFAGKVIGLGGAALLQMAVWSVAAVLILRLGGGTLNIPAGMQIPWAAVAWGLPFFLLGFALYGSLMAGLGAIAPNLREAGQSPFHHRAADGDHAGGFAAGGSAASPGGNGPSLIPLIASSHAGANFHQRGPVLADFAEHGFVSRNRLVG